jgi:hypothetical protein
MRFHPAKGLAIVGAMVAALTATACSSSISIGSPSSTTGPAATSSSAPPANSSAGASSGSPATGTGTPVAQITANWEAFFSSSTPNAQRATLLQNGSALSSAISSFSSNPLASGISAKVLSVTLTSATQATVKYDIDGPGGTTLLSNRTGTAVLVNGTWKVGVASFCQLLNLAGGNIPAACKS